jgi:hypothetical protein
LRDGTRRICCSPRAPRDTLPRMSPTGSTPQFNTAEYSSAGDVCKSCKTPITGGYFRINGMTACGRCADQVRQQSPKDTHSAYVRGIIFGLGGAILGFVLFAGFVIVTGISLGYISLAVGFLVGKAMKFGSNGIGGRRYQIAAAVLTYAAVSMAAIPIAIHFQGLRHHAAQTKSQGAAPRAPQGDQDDGEVDNPPLQDSNAQPKPKANPLSAFGYLALIGLASPFLELQDPLHGILGLVILFVGVQIAWKLAAGPKLDILGPFQSTPSGSLPSSAA